MKPTQQEPHRPNDLPATGLTPEMRKRLAIAGGLVAIALVAIPVLESFSGSGKPAATSSNTGSSGRIVNKDESSAPALVIAQVPDSSAAISSAPAATPPANKPFTDNQSPATPAPGSPLPATPPPGTPTTALNPLPAGSKPVAPPSTTTTKATAAHTAPAPASQEPTAKPAPPAPTPLAMRKAAAPTPTPTTSITESTAPANKAESTEAPPRVMPTLPAGKSSGMSLGYQVQLGLFASPGNAEKLVSDLRKHGLSARTETRVQLGPFRTKAEAEEAMQRLRELGYQPLLVPIGAH